MSIASKEAEDIYPVTNDELSVESIIMDNDDAILQKAYIAGRTAEPTDAEIEAGAKALWLFEHQDSYPTKELLHKSFEQAWGLDVVAADYCERSECLLKAARKAVGE